jgi:uncharacterized protein (TIGR04255 family)
MTRRIYKNPPIQEALCDVQVVLREPWTFTATTTLVEALAETYPGEPDFAMDLQMQIAATPAGMPQTLQIQTPAPKYRVKSSDGTKVVTFGPQGLSVHVLAPYEGWELFSERINDALAHYTSVAVVEGAKRVSVRYINRIHIDSERVELGDFFVSPPGVPGVDVAVNEFLMRVKGSDDHGTSVAWTAASDLSADPAAFILDIEAARAYDAEPLPVSSLADQIDELRNVERDAFEASLMSSLKDTFDA